MDRRNILKAGLALGVTLMAKVLGFRPAKAEESSDMFEITKTDEEWRSILTPEQYYVLRKEGTEPPFKNKYHDNKAHGTYLCAGCDLPLFSSDAKFDSGTGWPSFWKPIETSAIRTKTDWKLFYPRTEVRCRRCGGHLGHVFDDGHRQQGYATVLILQH